MIMKKLLAILALCSLIIIINTSDVKANTFTDATAENPCRITAIGDSITYPYSYADVFNSMPEYQVKNFAACGTQVAGKEDHSFVNRTKLLYLDSDIILIMGGTNDFCGYMYVNNPIGTIEDDGIETFCGAYNTMIKNLKQHNPMSKIVLLTPIKRVDETYINDYGFRLVDYVNAVMAIAKHNDLKCIDLYNDPACDFTQNGLLIDGLHPSRDGQRIMAGEINYCLKAFKY